MTRARKSAHRARAARKQTIITLRGSLAPKSWLLSGTALKIGLFAGVTGFVAAPLPAFADCGPGSGSSFICDDDLPANAFAFDANSGDWTGIFLGTGDLGGPAVQNGSVTIDNTDNNDGLIDIRTGAAINAADNHGLVVTNGDTSGTQTVTLDLQGTVTSTYNTTYGGDGVRLQGGANLAVTVGSLTNTAASITGTDDGLRILETGTQVTITNYGTILGNGAQTAGSGDPGFGIEFDQSFSTATGLNTAITASITIDNYGTIQGQSDVNSSGGYSAGINGGSLGTTTITNRADAQILGDTDGIYISPSALGGDVAINNAGHIEGLEGDGAYVSTAGDITGRNSSYASWIGDQDGFDASGNSFTFDNGGGLVWGKTESGFDVDGITGAALPGTNSVYIDNNGWWTSALDNGTGGVASGFTSGIRVDDVDAGDVTIDNNGYNVDTGSGTFNVSGGLILGGGDGVNIDDVDDGSVFINNQNTLDEAFATTPIASLDTTFTTAIGTLLTELQTDMGDSNAATGPAGIFGHDDDGVDISDVDGGIVVNNQSGVIAGLGRNSNGDGIHVEDVDADMTATEAGITDITNPLLGSSNVGFVLWNGTSAESTLGGVVWGDDDGVRLDDIDGDVLIANGDGVTYGNDRGIYVEDVWRGSVYVYNDVGGTIQGLYGDAIRIDEIDSQVLVGGHVDINNTGGSVFSGDRAIYVSDADSVEINNSSFTSGSNTTWGVIIGDGSWDQPVIRLRDIGDGGTDATAVINNNANSIISSFDSPAVTTNWSSPDPTDLPGWLIDSARIEDDVDALWNFVAGGDQLSTGQATDLAEWDDAADDWAIRSSQGGATIVNNNAGGLLVGRVYLRGNNGTTGNTVNNSGTWIVLGDSELHSGGDGDTINNNYGGLIQTAVDATSFEEATFESDNFNNAGIVSMADGGVGDTVRIGADTYFGDGGAVAIDFDLAAADSDLIRIRDGLLTGETSVIVRIVDGGLGGTFGTRIEFARTDDGTADDDAFVLDVSSDNFVAVGDGGLIADGLLGWYVDKDNYDGWDLVADWGPGAYNSASLITTSQIAFRSGLGIVEDHLYGGQFGMGGGGVDLPEGDGSADGTDIAAWVKGSGDYTVRETTVTLTPPGATLDTTSATVAGSLLGGLDITPEGGDFRIGAFAGYTAAGTAFDTGGVTTATFNGMSGGAYAAYNNGTAYADITGKVDSLAVVYDYAGSSATATALNLGVLANAGYRLDMGGAYVEPLGSFEAISTSITDVSGIDFHDGMSIRAGAGARLGTEFAATDDVTAELSLLGRVWNEFGGPNTTTVDDGNGNTVEVTDDIAGFYGELAATATFTGVDSGLSGFVTAGTTLSATSINYNAKGGLRVGF